MQELDFLYLARRRRTYKSLISGKTVACVVTPRRHDSAHAWRGGASYFGRPVVLQLPFASILAFTVSLIRDLRFSDDDPRSIT